MNDGTVVKADGSIVSPDGHIMDSDGTLFFVFKQRMLLKISVNVVCVDSTG
jgi:hypothetical protein